MRSENAPEGVVALRRSGVQAYPHISDLGLSQEPGHLRGNQGSIGGDDCPQAHLAGMEGQGIEIAAEKGLAAGEDEDGHFHLGQLIHQGMPSSRVISSRASRLASM